MKREEEMSSNKQLKRLHEFKQMMKQAVKMQKTEMTRYLVMKQSINYRPPSERRKELLYY